MRGSDQRSGELFSYVDVETRREMNVRPHVARKARFSAIDGRTARHVSYATSQRIRKRIEETFGWIKTTG